MRIHKLIKDTDPEQVERILEMARQEPCDIDKYEMMRSIVEKGATPYKAAQDRAKVSNRSFGSLYYHARCLVDELYEALLPQGTRDTMLTELMRNGEVHVPKDMLFNIRQGAREMGLEIDVDIRIRVARRKWGRNYAEDVRE